jgi:hypothetical protein
MKREETRENQNNETRDVGPTEKQNNETRDVEAECINLITRDVGPTF